jgi:hypothetical protein
VATLIGRLTRPALGSRGLAGVDLIAQWATIVGPELAVLATPQNLKGDRPGKDTGQGGTLQLRVASSAAAMILQLKGPQIVERVNRYFGYRAVARLQAIPGGTSKPIPTRPAEDAPLPPEVRGEIDRTVAKVAEPDLRQALARLGAAVRRRARTEG